jgi:hypothetical protein
MSYFDVSEEKKTEYWNYFLTLKKEYWAVGFTSKRLEKVKPVIWVDEDFWADIIHRHGGEDRTPQQMKNQDKFTYDHCMGNMMGRIFHTMINKGIIKT